MDAFLDSVGTKGCYYYYREEGVASEEVGVYTCLCTVAKTCKKTFIFSFEDFLWLLDLHYSGNGYDRSLFFHL